MKRGIGFTLIASLAVTRIALAEETDRSHTVFAGATLGAGVAWPDDREFSKNGRLGAMWQVLFGWGISRRWAVGIHFATWQDSLNGLPFHFHSIFSPQVEYTPAGNDGLVLGAAAGFGTTDGVDPPNSLRKGIVVIPRLGYRWGLVKWAALTAGAGTHVYMHGSAGTAVVPFLDLELRFYGHTDGR